MRRRRRGRRGRRARRGVRRGAFDDVGGGAPRRGRGAHVRRVAGRGGARDRGRAARVRARGRPVDRRGARDGRARPGERGGRLARSVQRAPRRRTDRAARRPVLRGPGRHVHRPEGPDRARDGAGGDHDGSAGRQDRIRALRRRGGRRRDRVDRGRAGRVPRDRLLGRRGHARRAGRRHADGVLVPDRSDGGGARSRGRGRGGRRTRGADARRDQAGDGPRAGAARPRRRVVVPRRPVGRVVGRVRAEAALAVRAARGRTGGGRRAHARGRRTVARRTRRGAVRRRRGADPADRAPVGRRAAGVPPQHLHGVARRHAFDRQRGAGLPLLARRRHHEPVRRARRSLARTAPAGGGRRRARAGRERCALGREPDQRRVLGGGDRPADLGRRARRAGARDDDREHDPRDAPQRGRARRTSSGGSPRSGCPTCSWAR